LARHHTGWPVAWQSSVSEQVPSEALPAAVALNGISYNIARSIGPAIGGIVVATLGAVAAFALNTLLYLPLIAALFRDWPIQQEWCHLGYFGQAASRTAPSARPRQVRLRTCLRRRRVVAT
jgi:MFS family permease